MWGDGGKYGDWACFLEEWARGQRSADERPGALVPEDFAPETWQRLAARLYDALEVRLERWAKTLSAALPEAHDEFTIGRTLAQSRTGLESIRALCLAEGLPEELRCRLVEIVDRHVRSAQGELERAVGGLRSRGDHHAAEILLRAVRANPLTTVLGRDASERTSRSPDPWAGPPHAPGRRVIID